MKIPFIIGGEVYHTEEELAKALNDFEDPKPGSGTYYSAIRKYKVWIAEVETEECRKALKKRLEILTTHMVAKRLAGEIGAKE
jgi:hypothetical protein